MPINKRPANVPADAHTFAAHVSKSDILDALWDLCAVTNDAGSCDDDKSTLRRLEQVVNEARQRAGLRAVSLDALIAKRDAARARLVRGEG